MMDMMPPFIHARIPATGWLRLLSFAATEETILKGNLASHSFENAPGYYALSYHWGDSADKISFGCDDGYIEVSRSLHRALLRLRTFSRSSGVSHFWVDQICINQADTVERTDQVLQMKRIYRQSEQTLIWLALERHQNSRDIFGLLRQVERARLTRLPTIPRIYAGRITKEENEELDLPDFSSHLWADLGEFVENPWFQRTWILQEAALSRISPLILCEDISMDFAMYLEAIGWLSERGYALVTAFAHLPATPTLINNIRRSTHQRSGAFCPWKLEAILSMANYLRATDPRDRIYAVLGLTVHGESGRTTDGALMPDYTRDVVELFISVTRYCIKESNRLHILASGGVGLDSSVVGEVETESTSFPSWVPRWDRPRHKSTMLSGPHKLSPIIDGSFQIDVVDEMPYNAANGLPPIMGNPKDHRELVLRGVQVDHISWASRVVNRGEFNRFVQSPIRKLWERALAEVGLPVDPEDQRFREFATSFYMAVGSGLDSRDHREFDKASSLNNFWRYLTLCYETDGTVVGVDDKMLETYRSLGADGDFRNVQSHLPGRKLFVTGSGRVGNGAATLQTGDDVFVLFGGSMPYVLRERGLTHEMIGEAYIDGFMEGEAVVEVARGRLEHRWVTLR